MRYLEVVKDLLTVDNSHVLAHCISADCAMEGGIALQFVDRNPGMREKLKQLNPSIGDAVVYRGEYHKVYNLITKRKVNQKPRYKTLKTSLQVLRNNMLITGDDKLAIPQIGSGIDGLKWEKVKKIIQDVFEDTEIDILVCKLDK